MTLSSASSSRWLTRTVCQLDAMQRGHATSALMLEYTSDRYNRSSPICWRRDFAVLIEVPPECKRRGLYRLRKSPVTTLRWRWYPGRQPPGWQGAETVPATRFIDLGRKKHTIFHVAANDDGILFIQMALAPPRRPCRGLRVTNVVYSWADDKILWLENINGLSGYYYGMRYLLGRERLYTISGCEETYNHNLIAEDFRSGSRLYKTGYPVHQDAVDTGQMRLLQATDDDELFVHLSPCLGENICEFHIVRVSCGVYIGHLKLLGGGLNLDNILTHPASGQMAVIDIVEEWFPSLMLDAHPLLFDSRFVILSYYSYNQETGYALLHTDALMAGPRSDPLQSHFNYRLISPAAINPFYRTAILSFIDCPPTQQTKSSQRSLWSYPFVPTEEIAIRRAVKAILKLRYDQISLPRPPLRQCWVLGDAVRITASPESAGETGIGTGQRKEAVMTETGLRWDSRFTGNGDAVFTSSLSPSACTENASYFLGFAG
ncbi:uncharacterized protein DSM5745_09846 [Aspergillus mulundensis]|uniref:Uncharacterized protein n=1 Tax=Aspergillus mulundensis TaxID=1810919 RepID=A0A3D8QRL4_9EURO|nr:hypothetical protein DSM5745_09846 [Aspergillus mulundensis]RDW64435.1 hypothetical protein DSM5745_09846 [Aspergillus mulundensis]